jgi:hypothetical protein
MKWFWKRRFYKAFLQGSGCRITVYCTASILHIGDRDLSIVGCSLFLVLEVTLSGSDCALSSYCSKYTAFSLILGGQRASAFGKTLC